MGVSVLGALFIAVANLVVDVPTLSWTRGSATSDPSRTGVDVPQRVGGGLEVVAERLSNTGRGLHAVEGGEHVGEPAIPLFHADRERRVAHPERRVSPLLGVGGRTAPVLPRKRASFRRALDRSSGSGYSRSSSASFATPS